MKKIIGGRVYNTATALEICEIDCKLCISDCGYEETTLYRSPRGIFFIAGSGNADSRWAQRIGNMYGPGDGIKLVTVEVARAEMEMVGCTAEDFARAKIEITEG